MSIKFTQYLMPDGRKEPVKIDRSENIERMAEEIIKKGYKFEIEMLRNGSISMTCENDDPPISHQICQNGPAVMEAVDTLVLEAYHHLFPGETNGPN